MECLTGAQKVHIYYSCLAVPFEQGVLNFPEENKPKPGLGKEAGRVSLAGKTLREDPTVG